jgi:hypothetical protein
MSAINTARSGEALSGVGIHTIHELDRFSTLSGRFGASERMMGK